MYWLVPAGMLAKDGRCRTLDAAAEGYVRAEAAGVLVLSQDTNSSRVQAILVGAAVNQDGRSSSLTAPNGPAQQEVVRQALKSGGVDMDALAAISMHGTGTSGPHVHVGGMLCLAELLTYGGACCLCAHVLPTLCVPRRHPTWRPH